MEDDHECLSNAFILPFFFIVPVVRWKGKHVRNFTHKQVRKLT